MGRILWYAAVTWDYIRQMLPGILLAAAVFFAVRPWRKKRLVRLELTSSPRREAALLLFAAFCAGLAALTLFPSGFWETFLRLGLSPEGEKRLAVLFPRVEFLAAVRRINWIPSFLLGKTLGAWSAYMVLANTLIFLPVVFFRRCSGGRAVAGDRYWRDFLLPAPSSFSSSLSGAPQTLTMSF